MPAIDDLRDLLDQQRRAIESSEPGVRDGADPESLHRFRVATRRSRALIRASRPLVRDQLANLDRELRWLGGVSGPVRDLDVLIDHLGGMLDELERGPGGRRGDHRGARAGARSAQRAILVEALDTDRYRAAARPVRRGSADAARDGRRACRSSRLAATRVRAAAGGYDELGPQPSDDDLHAVRIKAKHARYAAELAALGHGEELDELADALRTIQDLIGAHQDAVVAEERVRGLATRRLADRRRAHRRAGAPPQPQARAELPRALEARRARRREASF